MTRFTYKGNNDRFNPTCTSTLLFEDQDGSTERIFCEQTTCVDSHYIPTGLPTACLTLMVPVGHDTDKYSWGLEGGPWILNVNYSGAPYYSGQFTPNGFTLSAKPPANTGCVLLNKVGNTSYVNYGGFSNNWNNIPKTVGYQSLAKSGLNGLEIDPATTIGNNIFNPRNTNISMEYYPAGTRCGVEKFADNLPNITYYDVGATTRDIPMSHDVTFPNAYINLPNWTYNPLSPPTGMPASNGLLCGYPYVSGVFPNPDLIALGSAWSSNGGSFPGFSVNLEFPGWDGPKAPIEILTGKRMQGYVQQQDLAYLTTNGYDGAADIGFSARHYETALYGFGYKARWSFKSVTPQTFFTLGLINIVGGNYVYGCAARGSVTITVTYEPFPLLPENEYGPYDYLGSDALLGHTVYSGPWGQVFYGNPVRNANYIFTHKYSTPINYVSLFTSYSGYSINNPFDNRSYLYLPTLNYFKLRTHRITTPNSIIFQSSFGVNQKTFATVSSSPDNFYIYRKRILSSPTVGPKGIKITYSQRKQWFNGTCPFNLNYDYNLSDKVNSHNQCSSTIVPYSG